MDWHLRHVLLAVTGALACGCSFKNPDYDGPPGASSTAGSSDTNDTRDTRPGSDTDATTDVDTTEPLTTTSTTTTGPTESTDSTIDPSLPDTMTETTVDPTDGVTSTSTTGSSTDIDTETGIDSDTGLPVCPPQQDLDDLSIIVKKVMGGDEAVEMCGSSETFHSYAEWTMDNEIKISPCSMGCGVCDSAHLLLKVDYSGSEEFDLNSEVLPQNNCISIKIEFNKPYMNGDCHPSAVVISEPALNPIRHYVAVDDQLTMPDLPGLAVAPFSEDPSCDACTEECCAPAENTGPQAIVFESFNDNSGLVPQGGVEPFVFAERSGNVTNVEAYTRNDCQQGQDYAWIMSTLP